MAKKFLAATLKEVQSMDPGAFQAWLQSMQSSYAYSLGYRNSGQVIGLRLEEGKPSSLIPLMADVGDKLDDVGALSALGELAERYQDARGMLQLGKAALIFREHHYDRWQPKRGAFICSRPCRTDANTCWSRM